MIHYIFAKPDGMIAEAGTLQKQVFDALEPGAGLSKIEVPGPVDPELFFWKAGALKPLPEKPARWVVFDTDAEAWVDPPDLAQARNFARRDVRRLVLEVRTHFATDLPFQETAYRLKQEEAVAYLAMDPPPSDLSDFPSMAGEVGSTAETAYQLAQIWLFKRDTWPVLLKATDGIRTTTNNAIDAAQSLAEIEAIVDAARAAFNALMRES